MNLLVDTHAVIWFITDDNKLPKSTRQYIENKDNNCFISLASYWEIAIKYSLGRMFIEKDLADIFDIIEKSGFELLPVTTNHILVNAQLEFHHSDPFDRIIIAQGIVEKMTILSKDSLFKNYPAKTIWF